MQCVVQSHCLSTNFSGKICDKPTLLLNTKWEIDRVSEHSEAFSQ